MPETGLPRQNLVVETGVNLKTPDKPNHQRDSPADSPPWTPDSPSPLCTKKAAARSQSRRRRHHVTVFSKSVDWEISAAPTAAPTNSGESSPPSTEVFKALSAAEIAELRRVEPKRGGGEPEPEPEAEREPREPGWFTTCCGRPPAAQAQTQARAKPASRQASTRKQLPRGQQQRTRSDASMGSAAGPDAEDSFESARRMLRKTMSEDW